MGHKNLKLASLLAVILTLQGCAAALVGGTLAAASSLNEERSLGTQMDDQAIEIDSELAMNKNEAFRKHSHINVISFNRVVLLVGQVDSENLKQQAQQIVGKQTNVRAIHNFIRVGELAPIGTRTKDLWITSKVKTSLVNDDNVPGLNIKVTTEDSEVFLMGLVKREEADQAVEIARRINGVSRVVKLFEYL